MKLETELHGSKGAVYDAHFSPDKPHAVLTGGDDGVRVWDTATGKQVNHFSRDVLAIAVLPKPRLLVAGPKRLELWDYGTGKLLESFEGHEGNVYTLAVSPDGRHVLSGTGFKLDQLGFQVPGECLIRLWDLDSRQQVKQFREHRGAILSLAFLPDGKRFVSVSSDGTMRLWDLEAGKVLHTHGAAREAGTITKDGRQIVTETPRREQIDVAKDGRFVVRGQTLWDVEEWKPAFIFGKRESRPPLCGAFSPEDSRVLLGNADGTITLWDLATKVEVGRATAFVNRSTVYAVAFSPDGSDVVSAGHGLRGGFDAIAEKVPPTEFIVRVWTLLD